MKRDDLGNVIARMRGTWNEYPQQFWTLFFGTLINATGSGLVFPFFSLYLSRQMGFSMTEIGVIFAGYAVVSMATQVAGGALVDRLGRKPVMVFSLLGNSVAILSMGLISPLATLAGLGRLIFTAIIVALLSVTGGAFGPALNAMVADLVDSQKRSQAYGLIRVVSNLGIAIGPAIGGFIATRSYLVLFICAAISPLVYGVIVALLTRETRPTAGPIVDSVTAAAPKDEGFVTVLRDQTFMVFCGLYLLMAIVYSQMNTTLPIYLNKGFGVSEQWYGMLMSLNAAMVVLFQFPITRFTDRFARTAMMALGGAFFAVGFGMFGVVGVLPLFFLAQATWTIGEMLTSPVSQAFVADVAPETMRGRYMGAFGLVWAIGYGLGPLVGGATMDRLDSRAIWYAAFAINGLAALGFMMLGRRAKRSSGQNVAWAGVPGGANVESK